MELRPDDFQEIERELKREGRKQGLVIKSLNVVTYPARRLHKRYHVRYKYNKKHLLMDTAIIAALVLLVVFNVVYWLGGFHYFSDSFDTAVFASDNVVTSGAETTFVIDYQNGNDFALHLVNATLSLPSGFTLDEVSRTEYDWQNNTIYLGDLEPGANGRFYLSGQYVGDIEKQEEITVNFNYFKTNKQGIRLWGQFQETAYFPFTPTDSVVRTEVELPDTMVGNAAAPVVLTVRNNGDELVEEIKVQPRVSSGIEVVDPSQSYIGDGWYLYQVEPGQEIKLTPQLRLTSGEAIEEVIFDTFITRDNTYLKQDTFIDRPQVAVSHLDLDIIPQTISIDPGENAVISVMIENKYSDGEVGRVGVYLDLLGENWDIGGITGYAVQDKRLLITEQDYPELQTMAPGERQVIQIEIPVKEEAMADVGGLVLIPTINHTRDGRVLSQSKSPVEFELRTDLRVAAFARYYSAQGDQLGRGPLPPQVGQETTYWIFARVLSDRRALNDVRITAQLAPNVVWQNQSSVTVGQAPLYNAATRQISWQVDEVTVGSQDVGMAFEVVLTPTESQRGQVATLLQNINISGRDADSGELVQYAAPDVTTELRPDDQGAGLGAEVK